MGSVMLEFLNVEGNLKEKSGLNWGYSKGHTVINDSYIPIRQKELSSGIIPEIKGNKLIYDIVFDDKEVIKMQFEGSQPYKNKFYPKQLCSYEEKAILGKYFRKRLGSIYGRLITKEDLKRYGRANIELKLVDGNYYLDFSINK